MAEIEEEEASVSEEKAARKERHENLKEDHALSRTQRRGRAAKKYKQRWRKNKDGVG